MGRYDITQYQPLKTSSPPSSFKQSYRPDKRKGGVSLDAELRRWAASHVVPSVFLGVKCTCGFETPNRQRQCFLRLCRDKWRSRNTTKHVGAFVRGMASIAMLGLARKDGNSEEQRLHRVTYRPTVAREISIRAERKPVGSDWRWKRPTLISLDPATARPKRCANQLEGTDDSK
jgi:hypothetical protein